MSVLFFCFLLPGELCLLFSLPEVNSNILEIITKLVLLYLIFTLNLLLFPSLENTMEESSRGRRSIFYSFFVRSRVSLFRELSVLISSLHFTICCVGGWGVVRCSLGSEEPSAGCRPACEAPEPDRATSLLPGYSPSPDTQQSH